MKGYEEAGKASLCVNHCEPLIVRLDGHCFSTFTKGFVRPFDENLHRAMVLTTADLVERFHAQTGYTQSDEITLIWDAALKEETEDESSELKTENDSENVKVVSQKKKRKKQSHPESRVHLFGGRTTKISSVLSGFCSARFNYHLTQMSNEGVFEDEKVYKKHIQQRVISGMAHFDGRTFNVPSDTEVLNNIIWRCSFDCRRNSVSALARKYYSPKEMHGKGRHELVEMMKREKNVNWDDAPMAFRFGTFVKRELYEKEFVRMVRDKEQRGMAKRTRMAGIPIQLEHFEEKYMNMLLSKYWTEEWLEMESMQSLPT